MCRCSAVVGETHFIPSSSTCVPYEKGGNDGEGFPCHLLSTARTPIRELASRGLPGQRLGTAALPSTPSNAPKGPTAAGNRCGSAGEGQHPTQKPESGVPTIGNSTEKIPSSPRELFSLHSKTVIRVFGGKIGSGQKCPFILKKIAML